MKETERIKKARELRNQFDSSSSLGMIVAKALLPVFMENTVIGANNDGSLVRATISNISVAEQTLYQDAKDWEVGMATKPGDFVKSPIDDFMYVFSGSTEMTHTNSLFYPGAQGVYYWEIVPKNHQGVKVYPPYGSNITVAVKKDEIWYDTSLEHKWRWKGEDNNNCVWPPQEGNEWEKMT